MCTKKATHIYVLGELGRCPMYYNILNREIKYYTRLEGIPGMSLMYSVFTFNKLNDNRLCNIVRYLFRGTIKLHYWKYWL